MAHFILPPPPFLVWFVTWRIKMDVDAEEIPPIFYNLKQRVCWPRRLTKTATTWDAGSRRVHWRREDAMGSLILGSNEIECVFMRTGDLTSPLTRSSSSYDISHCCHHSRCVNPDHLSHEPHDINRDRERERCREAGSCYGHQADGKELKACILSKHQKSEVSKLSFILPHIQCQSSVIC